MTRPSDSGASGVDWGAPIPVNGKRPAWLEDDQIIQWSDFPEKFGWLPAEGNPAHWYVGDWDENIRFIRLPADHPHYRQPQPADTVTVGRMEALVRDMARYGTHAPDGHSYADDAKALAALLPDQVDPDLIEARKIADTYTQRPEGGRYGTGEWDDHPAIAALMEAIKRGRALATAEKALAWGEGE